MDPAITGVIIGISILIGIGGIRYFTLRHKKKPEEIKLTNPLLIKQHSKIRKLFV